MTRTTYTTPELTEGLRRQLEATNVEVVALERLQRGIDADVKKIELEIDQAWSQLAETLIPTWDAATFDRASALLKLPTIAAAQVERRLAEHLAKLRKAHQLLSSDPLYADRENKINEAQIKLAEMNEAVAPLQGSVTTLEDEPYFEELLAYRYGTESYQVKFYQLSYYTHWKHADLIVEKHGGRLKADTFGAIAAKYIDEKQAVAQLLAEQKRHNDVVAAADQRARQVAEAEQAIEQAVPSALTIVRARVREHLAPLPDADVAALLASVPDVDLAWRRIAGLKKKQEYLAALAKEQVSAPLSDLAAVRSKLTAHRNKLQRPKNLSRLWPAAEWAPRLTNDRAAKWQKRRERVQHTRHEIVTFHHYDRWDPYGNILWWDVMSDGRLDGNFIHEVRDRPHDHHHHHQAHVDTDTRDNFADVS
ncbi:MAG: hypothetical protein Q8O67_14830 [Deltaproteobacteria bacterium]|nr:hypothetical protein [Deltaproteobacteria bacterium]